MYFLFSYKWWISLIKLMIGPIINVRGENTYSNNFPRMCVCLSVGPWETEGPKEILFHKDRSKPSCQAPHPVHNVDEL